MGSRFQAGKVLERETKIEEKPEALSGER